MTVSGQTFPVGLPVIGAISIDPRPAQLAPQTLPGCVSAPPVDERHHPAALPVKGNPGPALLPLGAHKGPEFIHFQRPDAAWHLRLWHLGRLLADSLEHCVTTDVEGTDQVSHATAVERQDQDQPADFRQTAQVRIVSDELSPTIGALVALLPLQSFAILTDVP